MTTFIHLKTGVEYSLRYIAVDTTNSRPDNLIAVYSAPNGEIYARDKTEFDLKFKVKPNVCCVCGTTENLRNDGWYGYRCNSYDCVPY